MQSHKLACSYISLHAVTQACMELHELAFSIMSLHAVSWACMQFLKLACSFMSLHAWAWMQFLSLSEQLTRISQCLFYFLVYFLGIEENRRLARKHFHSRMRIFTKTRVTPDKDKDTPGDVILTVSTSPSINNSVLSLHHKTRGDSATAGGVDLTSEIMAEDSFCNLNVPN